MDRGTIRQQNDYTFDSRAIAFHNWLVDAMELTHDDISAVNSTDAVNLIGTFIHELRELTLPSKDPANQRTRMAATLAGYVRSAHTFLEIHTKTTLKIHVSTATNQGTRYDPYIADAIGETQKWQRKKPKIEPYTWDMFNTLSEQIQEEWKLDNSSILDCKASVFDWSRLGNFTGSRCGEYAQTHLPRGQYAKIPDTAAAGAQKGLPLAFIAADFVFVSSEYIILDQNHVITHRYAAFELHVTFRYDKSNKNFSVRKFRRGVGFLCPIDAAISILARAKALGVPENEPIGVFRQNTSGSYTFLTNNDVTRVMRKACKDAYPNKDHFLHRHVTRIVAHSNRVTAAVALYAAGVSIKEIAFRLRWEEESVDHYLRESFQAIGNLTLAAIKGAIMGALTNTS